MIATDDERLERMVRLTRDLMLIPGSVDRPAELQRCLDFARNHLEQVGGVVLKEYVCEGVRSLVALPRGVERPEVLLCSHVDVIAHADVRAYRSRLEGGRIIGPGAGDMKGQVAIMLELFQAFHQAHAGISLGLMLTTDEEVGGLCGVRHLFQDVGIRAGVVINPDGGWLNRITTSEKGICHLKVKARGRSAHGSRPWLGENALDLLLDSVARVRAEFGTRATAEDHWHATCSLTVVDTPNHTSNRIPEVAEAVLDIRFVPPMTLAEVLGLVEERLNPGMEMELLVGDEPLVVDPDPLYTEVTMRHLDGVEFGRDDGASDARFMVGCGVPVIIARPKVGRLHSLEEWIDVASMGTFFDICAEYITRRIFSDVKAVG